MIWGNFERHGDALHITYELNDGKEKSVQPSDEFKKLSSEIRFRPHCIRNEWF